MFGLDSLLGLPSQLIKIVTDVATMPITMVNSLGSTLTNTVSAFTQPIAGVANNLVNTTGAAVQNVTSSVTDVFSSPILLIGGAVVLLMVLKK